MTTYRHLTVLVEPDPDAVRIETLRGDDHLVAPVVAVAEGVLNGGFLPFEEIARSGAGWNGQPVTASHPEANGDFIPANDPEILEQYQIGRFLNAEADADDRKLEGEMWINLAVVAWMVENDVALADEARDTVEALKDGEALEVSTGYWHHYENQTGEFQGVEYEQVQTDVLPDHLATLPNSEGACNWDGDTTASGCGAPRTQSATNALASNGKGAAFAVNCDDCDGSDTCQCDGQSNGDDADSLWQTVSRPVRNALEGGDTDATDDAGYALHGANCNCSNCTMNNGHDDRLKRLAQQTEFSVEQLDAMDEETVTTLEASIDTTNDGGTDDGGDGTQAGNDGGQDDGDDTVADMSVDEFQETVAEVASDIYESRNTQETRADLKRDITRLSNFERDELPDDVEKLQSMKEKLDAQTATTPDFGGRAATDPDDESVDDVQVGGALTSQEAVDDVLNGD